MLVLFDTKVILDAMLKRAPWHADADALMLAAAQGRLSIAAATLTLATSFYIGRKAVGTAAARAAVRRYLSAFEVISIDRQTLLDADAMPGTDFEDNNILISAAVAASLDAIVTRNPADFAHSPIPVWEPAELLKRLSGGSLPPATGAGPATNPP